MQPPKTRRKFAEMAVDQQLQGTKQDSGTKKLQGKPTQNRGAVFGGNRGGRELLERPERNNRGRGRGACTVHPKKIGL